EENSRTGLQKLPFQNLFLYFCHLEERRRFWKGSFWRPVLEFSSSGGSTGGFPEGEAGGLEGSLPVSGVIPSSVSFRPPASSRSPPTKVRFSRLRIRNGPI